MLETRCFVGFLLCFKCLAINIPEVAAVLSTLSRVRTSSNLPITYPQVATVGKGSWLGQFGASRVGFCCTLPSRAVSFSVKWLERDPGWLHWILRCMWCDNLPVRSWLAEVKLTSVHPGFHLQWLSMTSLFHLIVWGGSVCSKHSPRKTSGTMPPGWHLGLWFWKGCYVHRKEWDLVQKGQRGAVMVSVRVLLPSEYMLLSWDASLLASLASSCQLTSWSHESNTN